MNHAWTVSTPVCALLKVSLFSVWMSCKYQIERMCSWHEYLFTSRMFPVARLYICRSVIVLREIKVKKRKNKLQTEVYRSFRVCSKKSLQAVSRLLFYNLHHIFLYMCIFNCRRSPCPKPSTSSLPFSDFSLRSSNCLKYKCKCKERSGRQRQEGRVTIIVLMRELPSSILHPNPAERQEGVQLDLRCHLRTLASSTPP